MDEGPPSLTSAVPPVNLLQLQTFQAYLAYFKSFHDTRGTPTWTLTRLLCLLTVGYLQVLDRAFCTGTDPLVLIPVPEQYVLRYTLTEIKLHPT